MKTCIFTVVFNRRSIHEALRIAGEIGYDGVELWGKEPHISYDTSAERVKEIRKLAEDIGLRIVSISTYEGNFSTASDAECRIAVDRVEKFLEVAALLDTDMLRIACGGPNAFLAEAYHYEKAAFWVQKCADLARDYNKRIVMEIHNNSLIETAEDALKLLNMVNRENAGVIHDAGNMYITDTDYGYGSISRLAGKIFHVHVKGERRIYDESLPASFKNLTRHGTEIFQQTLIKDGAVDYMPVFKALKEIGYDGYVSCECFADLPDVERAKQDYEEIKRLIAGSIID